MSPRSTTGLRLITDRRVRHLPVLGATAPGFISANALKRFISAQGVATDNLEYSHYRQ